MSESVHTNTSLWSKGMKAVIVAQFLSAFGDNALLFATLALLKAQFYPEWSQPILQMVFCRCLHSFCAVCRAGGG
ncbi:major facilitator superfamily protein [Escherichia coli]|uniref:Major facilitator superfamily protein n=1 Tax=Escherichia coli TaxID=562 RepID=A0A376W7H8_ECOLX|nr:major facilitator superfamily protein [Escherichia coli]